MPTTSVQMRDSTGILSRRFEPSSCPDKWSLGYSGSRLLRVRTEDPSLARRTSLRRAARRLSSGAGFGVAAQGNRNQASGRVINSLLWLLLAGSRHNRRVW
jgi:hypothetical protein